MAESVAETNAGGPRFADADAVLELVRQIAQSISNTALYGRQHNVTIQSRDKGFECVTKLLAGSELLGFVAAENSLLADGRPVELKTPLMRSFLKQLTALDAGGFSLVRGLTRDEFDGLVELLSMSPEKMKAAGSFSEAIARLGSAHVQAKAAAYRLVTEEETVVKKNLAGSVSAGGGGGDAALSSLAEELFASLRGKAEPMALGIDQAAGDAREFAELLLRAAEVTLERVAREGAEAVSDSLVNCFRRAYDNMLLDPAAKSGQGKKAIAKTLLLLQKEMVDGLRERAGAAADTIAERVAEEADDMGNELQIDALASDYARKRRIAETTEKKILRFLKTAGRRSPEAGEALRQRLMESGLEAGQWQELLVKSDSGAAVSPPGSPAGDEAIAALLAQVTGLLDPAGIAAGKPPATGQVGELAERLAGEVASVTAAAEAKLSRLGQRIRTETGMSRKAMLAILAEIGQEFCQPLSVITCAVDMLRQLAQSAITTHQDELLQLTSTSCGRLKAIVDKVIEISGMPKGTKPDAEILRDIYGS